MFGAFRPTSVSLGGLLWYDSLIAVKIHASNNSLTQENTLEVVSDTESKCSGPAKES